MTSQTQHMVDNSEYVEPRPDVRVVIRLRHPGLGCLPRGFQFSSSERIPESSAVNLVRELEELMPGVDVSME